MVGAGQADTALAGDDLQGLGVDLMALRVNDLLRQVQHGVALAERLLHHRHLAHVAMEHLE